MSTGTAGAGPLRRVLAVLGATPGPVTVTTLADRTGLDPTVVATAVDRLARTGRLACRPTSSLACAQASCATGCRLRG